MNRLLACLGAVAEDVLAAAPRLNELDGQAGDGDLALSFEQLLRGKRIQYRLQRLSTLDNQIVRPVASSRSMTCPARVQARKRPRRRWYS